MQRLPRLPIICYAIASVFYAPVVIAGAAKNTEWLDIYGLWLMFPMVISMGLYLYAMSFVRTTHLESVALNGSLMLGLIFGTPLIAWDRTAMQQFESISQTGPLIGIAGILLFINFLLFINLLMSNRKSGVA